MILTIRVMPLNPEKNALESTTALLEFSFYELFH